MKMKCTKIKNIDKSICTAEQKIAYNYAFMYADIGKQIINSDAPAFVKDGEMQKILNLVIESVKKDEKMKRFNIDAIQVSFRQGFSNYCENFFIASTYESIGECFKIPYEII